MEKWQGQPQQSEKPGSCCLQPLMERTNVMTQQKQKDDEEEETGMSSRSWRSAGSSV